MRCSEPGWRWQVRIRGLCHWSGVAELLSLGRGRLRSVWPGLRKDAAEVYDYVVASVSKYTLAGDNGPGNTNAIHMIYAGYEFDQAGWFALVFDRRPNAGHDGEWTDYLENNLLERPHWVRAAVLSGGEFSRCLGEMLVGVLRCAERDGVYSKLPLAINYRFGLEEFNGSFGWDSRTGYGGQPK